MVETGEQVWENIYRAASPTSSGKPGELLVSLVGDLPAGRALELGCAKGDDAVWLARKGWSVVAVDISATALSYAAANAERAGVKSRIEFERHDLSQTFPEGQFDLVFASFFQSPVEFPRPAVLNRAANAVVRGGHFLVIDHGSRAPWSWAAADTVYPATEQTLATLGLDDNAWQRSHVGTIERLANGPNGQTAKVLDNVLFLRRL
jgi:SAM-dependent methyltransferase